MTADFAYLHLHGRGTPYCGRYGTAALTDCAGWLRQQKVETAHNHFDNDLGAYAVRDALEFKEMLA